MRRSGALSLALALCACTQQPPADPRVEQFAQLPNWSGIWLAEGLEPGIDGFSMSRPPAFLVASARHSLERNHGGAASGGARDEPGAPSGTGRGLGISA